MQDSELNSVVVMQIRSFFLQEWAVLQRITRSKSAGSIADLFDDS
jgi:hypothetical protein